MIKFKSCPRCGGDLLLEEDVFGEFLSCLQCGFNRNVSTKVDSGVPTENPWWGKNKQVIELLAAGTSILEISQQTGRTEKDLALVKEQLKEMRVL